MPRKSKGSSGSSSRSSRKGSRRSKKNGVKVDFSGVEGRVLIPEGEYVVKVEEITVETSEAGNDYIKWVFRTVDNDKKLDNQPLYYNTSLQPQALWNLRNLLETLEVEVPDGLLDLDFGELIGLEMVAVVEHEIYEGKKRSRLVDFMKTDEGDGEEDEEKISVDKDEEESEDGLEPLSEEEVGEMSIEELEEVIEKYGLDVNFSKLKTARKKVNAILDALEEANYLADE